MNRKWIVTFTSTASAGLFLKETVEATDWSHAKKLMESKYLGLKVLNYSLIR